MTRYTEKFKISSERIAQMTDPEQMPKQLEDILSESKVLYTIILNYEYGKGNLQNVKMVKDSLVFKAENSGIVEVSYDINEFSVCAAIDFTGAHNMTLSFELDFSQGEISLTGEERYD
jgi:hypothetical protein